MGPQRTQNPPATDAPDLKLGTGPDLSDTSLSEALATLSKRRWILIFAVLIGAGYGAYKAFTQPKIYDASGTIQIHSGASNAYKLNQDLEYEDPGMKANTEIAILMSDTLLTTVAREMDLANNADFIGYKGPMAHQSIDDPYTHQGVIRTLQLALRIAPVPKTEILKISYSSPSPKLASDIINRLIADYIQRSYKTRFDSTQQVSQWLSGQLDDLKRDVEASQERMMELQRKLGALSFDSGRNELDASLDELLSAEGAAKIARIQDESRYRMVAGMDLDTLEGSLEMTPGTAPAEWSTLRARIGAAKATYAQLSTGSPGGGLGPNNPTMKALEAEIAELTKQLNLEQNRILLQSKETYLAAKAAEDKIEQELEAKKAEAYKQRDDLVEYQLRQREFEQSRTLYEGLTSRLRTAGVTAGLESLDVDVIDQARPPVYATQQPKSTMILTTSVFFLLGGIVLAFLLESLDTGLHNIAEIESIMELPSLAVIPRAKRATAEQTAAMSTAQRNVNVLTQPKSQFAEAFRSLRTSLLLASAGRPPKFILFTSATPSEGKTTTASNLACVLAQRDARVLLIDADLRRPNVHHRFGLSGKVGLTTLLAGTTTLEESLQNVAEVPNLDILPSGPVPPFPTEMLSSEAMHALLERLGNIYTHVVIDSPPILSVTDGVILGRVVDAVVLVIRHGKSSKHVIRRARDLLARSGASMAGIVLNAVDLNSPDYYGYYGYTGYSYSSADAESWETQGKGAAKKTVEGQVKR
jgi:succinoglycan biosynthesis transport protein ExoP